MLTAIIKLPKTQLVLEKIIELNKKSPLGAKTPKGDFILTISKNELDTNRQPL